jgi:hypothetical protein
MLRTRRFTVGTIVAVMVLGLVAGAAVVVFRSSTKERHADVPFTYAETIERVSPGHYADRRHELRNCVSGWEPWIGVRAKMIGPPAAQMSRASEPLGEGTCEITSNRTWRTVAAHSSRSDARQQDLPIQKKR